MQRSREPPRLPLVSQRMFSHSNPPTRHGMTRSAFGRSRRAPASALGAVLLLVAACGGAGSSSSPAGHRAASVGVCHAIAVLSDAGDAERAFDNEAHGALHALAADPRLDRAMPARVLESMERVDRTSQGPPVLMPWVQTCLACLKPRTMHSPQSVRRCRRAREIVEGLSPARRGPSAQSAGCLRRARAGIALVRRLLERAAPGSSCRLPATSSSRTIPAGSSWRSCRRTIAGSALARR